MKLEVLISCMRQNDLNIIRTSNIQSAALIINQYDINKYTETYNFNNCIKMLSTTKRGLSCSRNMALRNATGDICLLCDDDEIFVDNYEKNILNAFEKLPQADIIIFQVDYKEKKYSSKIKKLNYLTVLRVSSVQIAFRREKIIKKNIYFDESVGSGVSHAGGEEAIFLYECLKNKLSIYFYPFLISKVNQGESQWARGFTPEYFYDRGIFTRKMMGKSFATLYAIYFLIFKYVRYKREISFITAAYYLGSGIWRYNKIKI